ncbi:tRNA pseudouridine(55) synthase TruB [Ammoniphilus oxalaticus]|uniref:tRNA pseudouridine synthase B n=1 Tax=Ammoniphilus oxalaticus TaxID=66863 RepID=A0A419SJT1_9BACL|nr:tRNA pseudouridine(55) synthase TruB [Ammoniphilus oxalaticus]RKD24273.1 tRNA pseudouridine(55) synthase TruB [Ammoniphilus oxalaticus]
MSQIRGIIPLLKPPGFTSHDCVGKLRRLLKIKRIGHTGTLDPSVTGVLPLCIGQATRIVEYLQELPKEYVGTVVFGQATDTEDADGEIIVDQPLDTAITGEQIHEALASFVGVIQQVPPMYSAVKIDGVRLHKLAREGKEVERPPREVEIYELESLSMSLQPPYPEVTMRVKCSKGTYIRTLFVDIGKKLGYPAHMNVLQRTASEPFKLQDCYTFEQVEEAIAQKRFHELLKPLDLALMRFPAWSVEKEQAERVLNGQQIKLDLAVEAGQLVRIYGPNQQFLGLYRSFYERDQVWGKAEKVFHD